MDSDRLSRAGLVGHRLGAGLSSAARTGQGAADAPHVQLPGDPAVVLHDEGHTGAVAVLLQKAADAEAPLVKPSARMDIELELGVSIGQANDLGVAVPIDDAESHIFGLALFNDWSARDIQPWEYQPLGPFLAKNFASTVAPWVGPARARVHKFRFISMFSRLNR